MGEERFEPLRLASRPRLVAAFVLGPLLWVISFAVASVLIERTNAIELGLLIALGSFVVALVVLGVLYLFRRREERRYARR